MLSSSFASPTRAQSRGKQAGTPGSPAPSAAALATPAGVVATPARAGAATPKRAAAAAAAAPGSAPAAAPAAELRGLSGEMPTLWHLLGFEPEGSAALTPAQAHVLGVIAGAYDLAPGRSVGPVSGMSGEERLFAAYYSGRLRLLPGAAPPPLACNICTQAHLPSECPARLAKQA